MRKPRGELFFSAGGYRAHPVISVFREARYRVGGLTEDERRVGLLEPGEIPKVGRLAELVALRTESWR